MREIRKETVYAYQFIPLRRGATRARHNFTGRHSGKDAWFRRFAKRCTFSAAVAGFPFPFSVFSFFGLRTSPSDEPKTGNS
jgi:hypothetical protein